MIEQGFLSDFRALAPALDQAIGLVVVFRQARCWQLWRAEQTCLISIERGFAGSVRHCGNGVSHIFLKLGALHQEDGITYRNFGTPNQLFVDLKAQPEWFFLGFMDGAPQKCKLGLGLIIPGSTG